MLFNVLIRSVLLPLADWSAAAADTVALVMGTTLFRPISRDAASWD
jgi:hypothetical protein